MSIFPSKKVLKVFIKKADKIQSKKNKGIKVPSAKIWWYRGYPGSYRLVNCDLKNIQKDLILLFNFSSPKKSISTKK